MSPGRHSGDTDGVVGHVHFISLEYDPNNSDASALQLVTELRPEWKEPGSKIEFIRFTEGITNTLLKAINRRDGVSKEDLDKESILLRAYGNGTQVLIDRQREAQNHELLMQYGLAPALLARFKNGMMYKYISGKATSPEDLRKPSIYLAVSRRLAEWHATVPCISAAPVKSNGLNGAANGFSLTPIDDIAPGKPPPNVWTVMQKWLRALPTETEAQRERQAKLQKELARMVKELSQRPGLGKNGLVFAHCDLLSGNVIVAPKEAACSHKTEETVNFIDYEYATPSPAAFDLANHFAEWGGFDCDFSVLPTRAQRLEFIEEYIHTYFKLLPAADRPADLNQDTEVSKLCVEVDEFRGLPGFYWGIWALIQAEISQIDFDYADYAEIRLGEYWAWRDEVTGTRASEGRELPLRERRWAQTE
ncbi:kinase-like domain-containing protein [Truncatella angustata]|uniref:ethanolamine kinase n=1 Tax=Truncatella angustata TaxID=152316 RepID=A0A9P8UYK8_9PEZI|nr:kinase-like domain-containing protein [Truncatella angustata]KAH6660563.1 kinase-like domain-containing protein [Truncatella angustata]